jgi:hypothetical protein
MSLHLNFPKNGWEAISQAWSAWWVSELDRSLVVLECVEPKNETLSPEQVKALLEEIH